LDGSVSNPWDEEFSPSAATRRTLRWALDMGAATLGEAVDLLEQLELGNDVAEVLGEDGTVAEVRDELEWGLEAAGPDAPIAGLL
jgi:hypothetical protein